MKRALFAIAMTCLATPVFAQDIDLGLGGDASSLLNIPAPRGNPPARGVAPAGRGAPGRGAAGNAVPVDRLVRLRELFAQANMPLSKEQETALNALMNTEIPAMRQELQKRVLELQKAKGDGAAPPQTPEQQPLPGATPQRGAPPPTNVPSMEELTPEIIRLNDQLLGKMADATALALEQRTYLKKLYRDQVKSRGGFDAIKLTLEDAGAPFSAEQIAQIQPMFDQQNEARLQLLKGTQGQPPEKAKLDELQRNTLAKVLKLLTVQQRAALVGK
jgi:hypothetical protein